MSYTPTLNRRKHQSLVHYICHKAPQHALGSVKLHKVLFYSDMTAYLKLGVSITGETYVKQQFGPVSPHLSDAVDSLVNDGNLELGVGSHYDYIKAEYASMKKPSMKNFTEQEIAIVDEMIERICLGHTARSISDHTHNDVWMLAEIGEEIPYFTVFVAAPGKITPEDIEWAMRELKRLGKIT